MRIEIQSLSPKATEGRELLFQPLSQVLIPSTNSRGQGFCSHRSTFCTAGVQRMTSFLVQVLQPHSYAPSVKDFRQLCHLWGFQVLCQNLCSLGKTLRTYVYLHGPQRVFSISSVWHGIRAFHMYMVVGN